MTSWTGKNRRAVRCDRADRKAHHRGSLEAGLQPVGLYARRQETRVVRGYEDIKATGELIANSDLDWTLVRIPNLKDGHAHGGVNVGWYGKTKLGMTLSRGNLAKFLVDQVTDKAFVRAAPGIANRGQ